MSALLDLAGFFDDLYVVTAPERAATLLHVVTGEVQLLAAETWEGSESKTRQAETYLGPGRLLRQAAPGSESFRRRPAWSRMCNDANRWFSRRDNTEAVRAGEVVT